MYNSEVNAENHVTDELFLQIDDTKVDETKQEDEKGIKRVIRTEPPQTDISSTVDFTTKPNELHSGSVKSIRSAWSTQSSNPSEPPNPSQYIQYPNFTLHSGYKSDVSNYRQANQYRYMSGQSPRETSRETSRVRYDADKSTSRSDETDVSGYATPNVTNATGYAKADDSYPDAGTRGSKIRNRGKKENRGYEIDSRQPDYVNRRTKTDKKSKSFFFKRGKSKKGKGDVGFDEREYYDEKSDPDERSEIWSSSLRLDTGSDSEETFYDSEDIENPRYPRADSECSGDETYPKERGTHRLHRRIDRADAKINKAKGVIVEEKRRITETTREIRRIESQIQETKYEAERLEEIIDKRSGDQVILNRFPDFAPNPKTNYFKTFKSSKNTPKSGLAVVIPFFNEPSHELQQTLNSLYECWEYLRANSKKWANKEMYIVLIQDGWHKADPSMKQYIKTLFPKKHYVPARSRKTKKSYTRAVDWWDYYPDFTEYNPERDGNLTYIFQRENNQKTKINPQSTFKHDGREMNISLIVKINNRRKHNSHEWFMARSGFAQATNAEYMFMTDAFTLFNPTCLYHLVTYMDDNEEYAAVTGRQRVMGREQQGTCESIFSFKYMLRMVQMVDFESANAIYNGAFSMGGMLPVIPGPCGLYRASDILQNNVRDWYFGIVNEEPDQTGLVLGNLRIAEDRVLSYASVLKAKDEKYMAFNPHAIFYFEAELELMKFVLQRRRWINGSVAGYIWLIFMAFSDYMGWKTSCVRKFYIWFLLFCQFISYMMVAIAPAISIRILDFSIVYLLEVVGVTVPYVAQVIIVVVLWAIYLTHIFVHHKNKFNYLIFFILVLLSFATTILGMTSLIYYIFWGSNQPIQDSLMGNNLLMTSGTLSGYPLCAGIAVLVVPFILGLMISSSGHSPLYMYKGFFPFLLFAHVMVAWFGSYSYARIWDLSWGNRPADQLNDLTSNQRDNMMKKFKNHSGIVLFLIVLVNIGVFFIPFVGQIYIMTAFFTIALIQMFFSFLYLSYRLLEKIKFLCMRCKSSKKISRNSSENDIIGDLEDIAVVTINDRDDNDNQTDQDNGTSDEDSNTSQSPSSPYIINPHDHTINTEMASVDSQSVNGFDEIPV